MACWTQLPLFQIFCGLFSSLGGERVFLLATIRTGDAFPFDLGYCSFFSEQSNQGTGKQTSAATATSPISK
ncbi:hypothetical protein MCOR07_010930 [Pyricularia oryzae]|uniref:Secreted protein n=5 Tax=Pyricularia TaxID=48558 RepID=A0ABQ8N2T3_PYRGI|nr:uncharacterized protein MGG_15631 [Pyricularia oryzae 70-15]ELQ39846.1 hypothetical protein OOU_Y34scaffold00476g6 [Pyricularia oryzae Y34]KAH8837046.1 hypothetical protein MCOR01_010685 [Pyricularia oryzae]KAI6289687.1 hypothetical protein MCOR33_011750 [Pyricularia grisea]EHA54242.1 hypothetical protein MGG_15631 [Pyricularia oryzae 70-15]KAI6252097.1 hypothetical protein MCOR19_011278 [Pyricularia oryzae]